MSRFYYKSCKLIFPRNMRVWRYVFQLVSLALLFIVSTLPAHAAVGGTVLWQIRDSKAGVQMPTVPTGSAVDASGNIYITGYQNLINGTSGEDFYTIKLTPLAEAPWVAVDTAWGPKTYNEANEHDRATSIAIDSANNVIVAGNVTMGDGSKHIHIVKYSGTNAGEVLWEHTYAPTTPVAHSYDMVTSIAIYGNNVYVAGLARISGNTDDDILILKYDNTKTGDNPPVTAVVYNHTETQDDSAYIAAGENGVAVIGKTWDGAEFDMLTLKYDLDLTDATKKVWQHSSPGGNTAGNNGSWGRYVKIDSDGNVIASGFDISASSDKDIYTAKYCDNATPATCNGATPGALPGALAWERRYQGSFSDDVKDLAIDANKDVYITGVTSPMASSTDFYTAKYNGSNGTLAWEAKTDGGSIIDMANALVVDNSGEVYVTGYAKQNGFDTIQTMKYRKNATTGRLLWQQTFKNPDFPDLLDIRGTGIGLAAGGVVVTGWASNLSTPSIDSGSATTGSTTTLQDTSKTWTASQYVNYYLKITETNPPAGTNKGQIRLITGTGSDETLTVTPGFPVAVSAGDSYEIYSLDTDYYALKYEKGTLDRPTDLSAATLSNSSIRLAWTDNSSTETGFKLERCKGKGCDFSALDATITLDPDTVSYDDTGLDPDSYYYYRVMAYTTTPAENSGYSNSVRAVTVFLSYPMPLAANIFTYNGPGNQEDTSPAVAIGPDNNPVVTGRSNIWDDDRYTFDYYTIKLDRTKLSLPEGKLWSAKYDGGQADNDEATCLAVDKDNKVIVSGDSILPPIDGVENMSVLMTLKYLNPPAVDGLNNPTHSWSDQYNGPGEIDDHATTVATDASGNFVVVGHGTKDAGNHQEIYLVKYNADNSRAWAGELYDAGEIGKPAAVVFGADGNIFVTGQQNAGTALAPDFNILTIKYCGNSDPAKCNGKTPGQIIWSHIYDSSRGNDYADAMTIDSSNNVYVTGTAVNSVGNQDFYTIKFDGAVNTETPDRILWSGKGLATDGSESGEAVAVKIDLLSGDVLIAGTTLTDPGNHDFALIRYKSNGDLIKKKVLLRPDNDDHVVNMALDASGNAFVAGNTSNGNGTASMTIQFDANSDVIQSVIYNASSAQEDVTTAIAVNNLNDAFVVGTTRNASIDYLLYKVPVWPVQAPAPVTVTSGYTNLAFAWPATSTATGVSYKGKRADGDCSENKPFGEEFAIPSNSYSVSSLPHNTTYCYAFKTSTGSGDSRWVPVTAATATPAPPTATTTTTGAGITTAAFNTTTATVNWTANTTGHTGFEIERCEDSTATEACTNFSHLYTASAIDTSYRDSSVCSGKVYRYRVKTLGSGWESGWSVTAGVITPAFDNLVVDSGFEAPNPTEVGWRLLYGSITNGISFDTSEFHSGSTSLKLDATGAQTGLAIGRRQVVNVSPGGRYQLSAWFKSNLNAGGTVQCQVAEINNAWGTDPAPIELSGTSDWTNVTATISIPASPAIPAPRLICRTGGTAPTGTAYVDDVTLVPILDPASAAYSESQVNLTWKESYMDETGYEIWRCKTADAATSCADGDYVKIETTPSNFSSYGSAGLEPNAWYRHKIRAVKDAPGACNNGWIGPYSAVVGPTQTLYTKPTLSKTIANTTQVNLSWNDTTSAESSFLMQRCTGAGCTFDAGHNLVENTRPWGLDMGTAQTWSDTDVCTSSDYQYRVKPVNNGIQSASGSWSKSAPLVVSNFRQDFITRVKILGNAAGYPGMKNDFSDIRFYDEIAKKELPYWIESKSDTNWAIVWLKTGSGNSINLYYGNGAAASASNLANVFGSGVKAILPFNETPTYNGYSYDMSGLDNYVRLYYSSPYGVADPGVLKLGPDSGNVLSTNGTNNKYGYKHYAWGGLNLPTGGTATIEAWIYPYATQTNGLYNGIVSFGSDATAQRVYLSLQDNGRPATLTASNDFVPSTGPQAVFNAWNHIAVVLNGTTTATLYMNGVPVSGTLSGGLVPNLQNTSGYLFVGADRDGRAFNGLIDDIRIYNRALTPADFAMRYAQALPAVTVGAPVASTPFSSTWGDDDSYYSNTLPVTMAAPVPPTSLNAVANNETQITLTWTNKTSDQTGFKIYRCSGSGCSFAATPDYTIANTAAINTTVTYVDNTGLVPGTLYKYKVQTYKTGVTCPWESAEDTSPTNKSATPPLTAPSGLARTYTIATDCNDLRFVDSDGTTPLPYWLESGCNTARTRLTVKIPSIPNGSKQISLLYGNPAAAAKSDGINTFQFFEDFKGSTVDLTKWTITGGDAVDSMTNTGMSISGGFLHGGQSGVFNSRATFASGQSLQAKVKINSLSQYNTPAPILSLYQDTSHYSAWTGYSNGFLRFSNYNSTNQDSPAPTAPAAITDNLIYTLAMNDNGTVIPQIYDVEPNVMANYFAPAAQSASYTSAVIRFGGNASYPFNFDWDWIRVRKTSSTVNVSFTLLGSPASSAYNVPDGLGGNETGTWGVKRTLTLTNSGTSAASNWQVDMDSFTAVTGSATAGSSKTVLEDTSKTWTVNQWGGYYLKMTGGTAGNIGQIIPITGNTPTVLLINPALANSIAAGDSYQILGSTGGTFLDTTVLANDQIQLSWTNSTVSETGYIIDRCDNTANSGNCATTFSVEKTFTPLGTGVTFYIDRDIKRNNAYCYRLAATRSTAPTWTTSVSGTSCEPARQQQAPVLTVSGSTSQINLSWTETDFVSESGTATGGSTTTLVHSGKTWGTNQWAGFYLKITSGSASGQLKKITGNTNNTLTVGVAFSVAVASGNGYQIIPADGNGNVTSGIIGEYGYEIERCAGIDCTPTSADRIATLAPNAARTYTDPLCSGTYNYKIHVVKYGPNGAPLTAAADTWPDYSNKAEASINSAPVPTLVKATRISESQATLTWQDNTVDETSFNIYRCKDVGGVACTNFTLLGTSPSISGTGSTGTYNDTKDMAQGATYRYQVKATGTGAVCPTWESVAGTPDPAVYPSGDVYATTTVSLPGTLMVTADNTTSASIAWGDTTTTDSGFILERCAGVGCTDFTPVSSLANGSVKRNIKVFYPFNNSLKDTTGSGLDLSGTATLSSSGVTFANATDSLKSPVTNILNTDNHAIEFDFKINAVPTAWARVFGYMPTDNGGSDRSPGIWVRPNEKRLHWRYHDSARKNVGVDSLGVEGEAGTEFTLNQWYHIRGEKSGSSFKIYLDGKLIINRTDIPNPKFAGNAQLLFGYDGASSAANVSIKNFNIDDGVTSTATTRYKAYYTFNSTLADSSGNGLDLVRTGGGSAYYVNGGLNFNGSLSYTSPVTGILDTDSHVIEFDLRLSNTSTALTKIFGYSPTDNNGSDRSPGIFINPNAYTLQWRYHDSVKNDVGVSALGVDGEGGTPLTQNQWFRIRGEKSGSSFRIFVNGRLVVDRNDLPNPKFSGAAPLYFSGTNLVTIKNFSIDGNIQSIDTSECANTTYSYRLRSLQDGFASAKVRIDNFRANFPTRVIIPASFVAGRDRSQITDLRFYDYTDKADIPYWLENTSPDGTALAWIKTRSSNTIMLYANKSVANAANVSDGTKVFEFFDDFTTLDSTKWSKSDPTAAITVDGTGRGSVRINTGAIYSNTTLVPSPQSRVIEMKSQWTGTVTNYSQLTLSNYQYFLSGNSNATAYSINRLQADGRLRAQSGDGSVAGHNVVSEYYPNLSGSPLALLGSDSIIGMEFQGSGNISYYSKDPATYADFGRTTRAATVTMQDTAKNWEVNALAGKTLQITSGANIGLSRSILSNTATSIAVATLTAETGLYSAGTPFPYFFAPGDTYQIVETAETGSATGPWSTPSYLFLGSYLGSGVGTSGGPTADNTDIIIDWVRVRPYASPEPIGTIESSQVIPALDPGQGGSGSWTSGSPVTIGNFQPNYQTRLEIRKAVGMKNDFSDIRFFDTTARVELPYYFESITPDVKAVVWLKTGATNSIVMYYGNQTAASTAITAASMFDFYEDFTTLDASRWARSATTVGIFKGTAGAGSSATNLQDDGSSTGGLCTGATWTADCYKDYYLLIMNVTDQSRSANLGQYRKISASSTDRLITLDVPFDVAIGAGDTYQITYDPTNPANLSDAAITGSHTMTVTKGALYSKQPVISGSPIGYVFEMKNKWTTSASKGGGLSVSNSQYATSSNGNDYNEMFFAHADLRLQAGGLQAIGSNGLAKTWNVGSPMMTGSVSSGGNTYTNVVDRDWISAIEFRGSKDIYYSNRDPLTSEVRYYMALNNASGVWAPLNPYPAATAPYIFLGHIWGENASTTAQAPLNVDWIRVRKIAYPEPSAFVTTSQFPTLNTGTGGSGSWTIGTQLRISNFLADYQTRMTISAAQAAAMKSDFSDLRFYDTVAQKELPYWIEGNVNLGAIPVLSNNGGGVWKLREPVTITNYQPNFVTRVIIPTASLAAMKSNLADLRFYDYTANEELPYWVESVSSSSSTAKVWIKTGASTANTIAMYYGNALATSPANSTKDAVFGTGLVGYWPFEEAKTTAGNISDVSGSGLSGVLNAVPAGYGVVTGSKFGNGLSLDGAAGYVSVADSGAGSPLRIDGSMTVEFWYKHDKTNVQNAMLLKKADATGNINYSFYVDGLANDTYRNLIFRVTSGAGSTNITAPVSGIANDKLMSDGNWYHLLGRYNSSTGVIEVFINGVKTATANGTSGISAKNADGELRLGRTSGTGANYLKGMIDEVRIYNRALTDPEIAARSAANMPSVTVGYPPVWIRTGQFNSIAMYYGNPSATASPDNDGNKVFDFFEGFDSIDGLKWGVTGAASANSSKLTVTSGAVYSKAPILPSPQNLRFEMKGNWQNVTNGAYGGLALADVSGTYSMNGNNNKLAYLIDGDTASTILYPYGADGTGADPTNMYNIIGPGGTTSTAGMLYNGGTSVAEQTIRKPESGFWSMPDGSNITDIYIKGKTASGGHSDFHVYNASNQDIARVYNRTETGAWVAITPTSGIYDVRFNKYGALDEYGDVTQVKPGITGYNPGTEGQTIIEFTPEGKLQYLIKGSDNSELKRYTVSGAWNSAPYLWLGYFKGANSAAETIDTMTVDWVRARKYSAIEPVVISDAIGVNQEAAPETYQFLNSWGSGYSNTVTFTTPQVANLISNPDFEGGTEKWTVGSGASGDASVAVSGIRSLKISKSMAQNTSETVSTTLPQLTPGGSYTLTGNIKASLSNGYAFCRLADSAGNNVGQGSPEFDLVSNANMQIWTKHDTGIPAASNTTGLNGNIPLGLATNQSGDIGSIQSQGIIVDDGGVYRTWYTGNDNGASGAWRIFYATSSDGGVTWDKLNNTIAAPSNTTGSNGQIPLGTNDANIGDRVHTYASSSVIKDLNAPAGERYKMWYSGHDGSRWRIYYATSPDGLIWTKYDNTIPENSDTTGTRGRIPLGTTGNNKGDSSAAFAPSVIQLGPNSYQMWYAGADDAFTYRIYHATSTDGLTWTKVNNDVPANSNAASDFGRIPFGTTSAGKGDVVEIRFHSVIKDDAAPAAARYKIWYSGKDDNADTAARRLRIYYAESPDGLVWTKKDNTIPGISDGSSSNGRIPVANTGTGDPSGAFAPTVVKVDASTYKMWYAGMDGTASPLRRIYYATSTDGLAWTKQNNNIPNTSDTTGKNGSIPLGAKPGDSSHVIGAAIIKDNGLYRMWYGAQDGVNWRVYYASSPDGLTWTKLNSKIPDVLDITGQSTDGRLPLGSAGSGDSHDTFARSVIIDNSAPAASRYKMWYGGSYDGTNWRIYYAFSSDGLNWSKYDNSKPTGTCDGTCLANGQLPPGGAGKGDSASLTGPYVIQESPTSYKMWYSGSTDNANWRVFYATSTDGITWTKLDNSLPSTSGSILEPMDAGSTPTNGNGRLPWGSTGKGDAASAIYPVVFKENATLYRMWYAGKDGSGVWRIYYATSADGLNWTKQNNTSQADSDVSGTWGRLPRGTTGKGDVSHVYIPTLIQDGSTYRIWYGGLGGNWRLFSASLAPNNISTANDNLWHSFSLPVTLKNTMGSTAMDGSNLRLLCGISRDETGAATTTETVWFDMIQLVAGNPFNLTATKMSESQINLGWTNMTKDESGFKVLRCSPPADCSNQSNFTQIATTAAGVTSYKDTAAQPGASYQYEVVAYKNGTCGWDSNASSAVAVTTSIPSPASLIAKSINSTQVDLGWTEVSQSESGFAIERSSDGGTTFGPLPSTDPNPTLAVMNSTSFSDATACPDTTYSYRIRSLNKGLSLDGGLAGSCTVPGDGWSKRKHLYIANFQAQFQTMLSVSYTTGMKTDFSDLRFYDATALKELPYWIESITGSPATARVWLKTGDNNNIDMYYGNQRAASPSNAAITFDLFENFDGTALDAGKWTTNNASGITVSGGNLHFTNSSGQIKSNLTFNPGSVVEFKAKTTSWPENHTCFGGFDTGAVKACWVPANLSSVMNGRGMFYQYSYGGFGQQSFTGNPNFTSKDQVMTTNNLLYRVGLINSTNVNYHIDELDRGIVHSDSGAVSWGAISNVPVILGGTLANPGQSYAADYDWVRVRKYAAVEPSVTLQVEITSAPQSTCFSFQNQWGDEATKYYSNTSNPVTTAAALSPSNLTTTEVIPSQVNISWLDNTGDETGFEVQDCCTGCSPASCINVTVPVNTSAYSATSNVWGKRTPVSVSNFQPNTATRLVLTISDTTGVKSDLSDIRFYDTATTPATELPYWIENISGGVATVWVKTGANDSIYLYYGNANGATASSASAVFGSGLAGYWPFKEAVGTTTGALTGDSSGKGMSGTFTGGAAIVADGKFGNGVNLNGTSSYANVTDSTSSSLDITGDVTVETWFKYTGATLPNITNFRFVSKRNTSNKLLYELFAGTASHSLGFYVSDGSAGPVSIQTLATAPLVIDNNWHHLAGRYVASTGTVSVILDGVHNTAFDAVATTPIAIGTSNQPLTIGAAIDGTNQIANAFFLGTLDEVRVYNRALSDAEIASHYNAALTSGAASIQPSNEPVNHCYSVRAVKDGAFCGWPTAWSTSSCVSFSDTIHLDAVAQGPFAVKLFWNNVPVDGRGFEIEKKLANGNFVNIATTGNLLTYTDKVGIEPLKPYIYRVKKTGGTALTLFQDDFNTGLNPALWSFDIGHSWRVPDTAALFSNGVILSSNTNGTSRLSALAGNVEFNSIASGVGAGYNYEFMSLANLAPLMGDFDVQLDYSLPDGVISSTSNNTNYYTILRLGFSSPSGSNYTITLARQKAQLTEAGSATTGTADKKSLTDARTMAGTSTPLKNWTTDQFKNYYLQITSGANNRQTRLISSNTANTITVASPFGSQIASGDAYSINSITGSANSAGTSSLLNDTLPGWTANQWVGFALKMNGGTNAGQTRPISANTTNSITVSPAFSNAIASGDSYQIIDTSHPAQESYRLASTEPSGISDFTFIPTTDATGQLRMVKTSNTDNTGSITFYTSPGSGTWVPVKKYDLPGVVTPTLLAIYHLANQAEAPGTSIKATVDNLKISAPGVVNQNPYSNEAQAVTTSDGTPTGTWISNTTPAFTAEDGVCRP